MTVVAQARIPAGLKVVKLKTAANAWIWLNLSMIKSFASVPPPPDIEVPDNVRSEHTFITLAGENRGVKVIGTPEELIETIKTSTILL